MHRKYRCFEDQKARFGFRFENSGYRFGSYFTLGVQNSNGRDRWKIIFPLRLAIVNGLYVNYEITITATSMLMPRLPLLISSNAKR